MNETATQPLTVMQEFTETDLQINFEKFPDGLVPAIIQDIHTRRVLMLGYMNREALDRTIKDKRVTFYSRSKQRLWMKGEESGHLLMVEEIRTDCDQDAILVKVRPLGAVCHTGADTCFNEPNVSDNFLEHLENVIRDRKHRRPENSYTARLFAQGINRIAQKLGEEAVEVVIEAKDDNEELFLNEAADLLYHYLVLLAAKGYVLNDVIEVLKKRHH
ncbi:phosphoribosyl-ATP pyrophosphatase /phosphoribosyl-AMP cyclohydrolase [Thermoflavifilum aggregans]|uniref:Histidine biosynthesis bifunctional protein HisIE n=2 Tax=Thermoflavifilum aggregans TaxID=454188 RepID=A0A2M9CWH7_9BACT|nr:phosphoribosyl-ATP pyrophosphatase /phosphoribosyl-AMP cyclohydrolase [Thermoflavifilum aggregans]